MIGLFEVIIMCFLLSKLIDSRSAWYDSCGACIKYDTQSKVFYFVMLTILIFFAGLRTRFNDTHTYIVLFNQANVDDLSISMIFDNYGGFEFYQHAIKRYISDNPQVFIFITTIITTFIYVSFIARHSEFFADSMLLYLIGFYVSSMAALKQILAIGICFYALEAYFQRKYIKSVFFFIIAFSFHPYIICLLCIPFLTNKVLDGKTIAIIFGIVLVLSNLERVFILAGMIGKEYTLDEFTNYTINPLRVLVEMIPVAIIIINKERINRMENRMLILGANLITIGAFFLAMGLFYNPMYMGRLATYFSIISMVAIPSIIREVFREKFLVNGYYLLFVIYFIADTTKLGTISIFTDIFMRTSFMTLFQ